MNPLVVSLGEILFDRFENGSTLGGAPTNFAGHVASIGKQSAIISAIGNDDLGKVAYTELNRRKIDTAAITLNEHPTGTVDVVLRNGQPSYTINAPAAWDAIELNSSALAILSRADAVCFGTLAQRSQISRASIRQAVENCSDETLKLLDVNLRAPFFDDEVIQASIQLANAVKLNDEEVAIVANALGIDSNLDRFSQSLVREFDIRFLMITLGADGALLYRDGQKVKTPSAPVSSMVSTVGAGDSFAAAAVCGYLDGDSLEDIGRNAAQRAARTCTHAGGLPLLS